MKQDAAQALPGQDTPPSSQAENFVVVRLQTLEDAAADGHRTWIMLDPADMTFWVMRSGGYVGATQWHGPARLLDDGTVVAVPRASDQINN